MHHEIIKQRIPFLLYVFSKILSHFQLSFRSFNLHHIFVVISTQFQINWNVHVLTNKHLFQYFLFYIWRSLSWNLILSKNLPPDFTLLYIFIFNLVKLLLDGNEICWQNEEVPDHTQRKCKFKTYIITFSFELMSNIMLWWFTKNGFIVSHPTLKN